MTPLFPSCVQDPAAGVIRGGGERPLVPSWARRPCANKTVGPRARTTPPGKQADEPRPVRPLIFLGSSTGVSLHIDMIFVHIHRRCGAS